MTVKPHASVRKRWNTTAWFACDLVRLAVRPVNSDFDIFIRILFYQNYKWREDARKLSRPRHGLVNPLSAIWRKYPSSKWSSQWPHDGYIRHGWMTSCGRGRDSATPECFGRGSQGTIFVRTSKISLFFPEICSFRRVFVSRAFVRFGAKRSNSGAFGFDDVLELFLETLLGHRASFCELRLRPRVFFENFLSFFKTQPVLLAWQLWWSPGWTKHFGDDTSTIRMKSSLPGVGEIERRRTSDRRRDWYESLAVIHGQKEKKKNTRTSPCDCAKSQPFIIDKPASFEEPVSKTKYRYRFALRCFHVRGCIAAGRSGCSAGTAKKSSHLWHFRCWSPTRNELECINLVYWREVLYGFSSRDAIIVCGSALEKHFEGEFTPDQEREITFKRWPPGYQSWKFSLALYGLTQKELPVLMKADLYSSFLGGGGGGASEPKRQWLGPLYGLRLKSICVRIRF